MNLFAYTYDLVRQIPPGRVSTYGAVAIALGDIRAARAVGRMMNQNPDPDTMPCFKIVYADGRLGGFGLGIEDKIKRLRKDNVQVVQGRIVDFDDVFFDDFTTTYPLKKLRHEQETLSKQVQCRDSFDGITTVAGFDVAYPDNEFEECCGACVVMNYKTGEIQEEQTVFTTTEFPYIPTYLSFRELPVIQSLYRKLHKEPSLLMIDGNGVLHPSGLGLASHVGVSLDVPSIGVAKSLLQGKIKDKYVEIKREVRGQTVYATSKVKNPVYVSLGHRVSLPTAVRIVSNMSTYKIPEPLRQAHMLAGTSL
jgi:deoxyribonuclease V